MTDDDSPWPPPVSPEFLEKLRDKAKSLGDSGDYRSVLSDYPPRLFYEFLSKRESLRLKKESGSPWPWSDDEILNTYKFTNVKREHDRTTRWMRENWTGPNSDRPKPEIVFNCGLFRYFGTTSMASEVGWQSEYDPDAIVAAAERLRERGENVFTAAYIVPALNHKGAKHEVVARVVMAGLWEVSEELSEIAESTNRWGEVARRLSKIPGFGGTGFMVKEVLQDAMHTPFLPDPCDRNTWCPVGPGARRGLNRLAGRPVNSSQKDSEFLKEMISLFDKRSLAESHVPDLELHDVQFQLCEFDKYERVRLGEGRPKAKYSPPSNTEHIWT